jgi:hypothetical protein
MAPKGVDESLNWSEWKWDDERQLYTRTARDNKGMEVSQSMVDRF